MGWEKQETHNIGNVLVTHSLSGVENLVAVALFASLIFLEKSLDLCCVSIGTSEKGKKSLPVEENLSFSPPQKRTSGTLIKKYFSRLICTYVVSLNSTMTGGDYV